jgi:hypothetical protein
LPQVTPTVNYSICPKAIFCEFIFYSNCKNLARFYL